MSSSAKAGSMTARDFWKRVTQPIWLLSIGALFLAFGIYWVVNHVVEPVHFIYCKLDDYIPFNEWFALPYVYWFGFLPVAMVQMLWHREDGLAESRSEFVKYMCLLFISWGMCLVIYVLFPNAIDFRPTPEEVGNANFCAAGLAVTYSGFDLPNNVLPSLHCTSTIASCIGVLSTGFVRNSRFKGLYYGYYIVLTVLICAATVFVKQHSILDVFAAIAVIAVLCPIIYLVNWQSVRNKLSAGSMK